jgi:hypothetical protein
MVMKEDSSSKNSVMVKQEGDDITSFASANGLEMKNDEHDAAASSNGDESDASESDIANPDKATSTNTSTKKTIDGKRFLPSYKKPDAALTFPEKVRVARDFCSFASDSNSLTMFSMFS